MVRLWMTLPITVREGQGDGPRAEPAALAYAVGRGSKQAPPSLPCHQESGPLPRPHHPDSSLPSLQPYVSCE